MLPNMDAFSVVAVRFSFLLSLFNLNSQSGPIARLALGASGHRMVVPSARIAARLMSTSPSSPPEAARAALEQKNRNKGKPSVQIEDQPGSDATVASVTEACATGDEEMVYRVLLNIKLKKLPLSVKIAETLSAFSRKNSCFRAAFLYLEYLFTSGVDPRFAGSLRRDLFVDFIDKFNHPNLIGFITRVLSLHPKPVENNDREWSALYRAGLRVCLLCAW